MTIVPDTKDWTWVLQRTCPECGFNVTTFPREEIGQMIRDNAREWQELLAHPDVARRPAPDVWSGLEYGCHIRDIFKLYDYRLRLMLTEDDPAYPNWDQNATAIEDDYGSQDASTVATELEEAATTLAADFDGVSDGAWSRTGRRSDGATFTIESFARYLIHDPIHHLADVRRGYERLQNA